MPKCGQVHTFWQEKIPINTEKMSCSFLDTKQFCFLFDTDSDFNFNSQIGTLFDFPCIHRSMPYKKTILPFLDVGPTALLPGRAAARRRAR